MCLKYQLPRKNKNKIIDKIDRKGITVYKVVTLYGGEYSPVYNGCGKPYEEGVNIAKQVNIYVPSGVFSYKTGFHFFKTKAAAKRLCEYLNIDRTAEWPPCRVIACTIKKSWITEIGQEQGRKGKHIDRRKLETIIIAKKAIFPKRRRTK